MGLLAKMKLARQQKRYTAEHRRVEHADSFRLIALNYDVLPTYMGRRPWCDTILQECPVPGHTLCCYCTHSEKNPRKSNA